MAWVRLVRDFAGRSRRIMAPKIKIYASFQNTPTRFSSRSREWLLSRFSMSKLFKLLSSSFMMIPSHLVMKIQNLLTLHSEMVNKIPEQKNIEKSIGFILLLRHKESDLWPGMPDDNQPLLHSPDFIIVHLDPLLDNFKASEFSQPQYNKILLNFDAKTHKIVHLFCPRRAFPKICLFPSKKRRISGIAENRS